MNDEFKNYFIRHSVELNTAQLNLIDTELGSRELKKNEIILHQGEMCKYTFFVAKGLLRSYTLSADGKEHIIQFAPENWFISDRSSVLFNDASEQFVEAVEDAEVLLIESDFFEKMSDLNHEFQRFNMFLLHNHIRHLQKRINQLLSATAEERYLDFIGMYPDLFQRVPQWMVASYLGITPESLSRVRKDLALKNFKIG